MRDFSIVNHPSRRHWVFLALAVVCSGCKEADDVGDAENPPVVQTSPAAQPVPTVQDTRATPPVIRPDIDQLRSLPYVGFAEGSQNDAAKGVVIHDPLRSYPGYTLYNVQMLSLAELIDPTGNVVRRWHLTTSNRWERAELLPNGDLLVVGVDPFEPVDDGFPDDARYLMRLGWNGEIKWKRRMNPHHDIELTPRGQLLAMSFKRTSIPEVNPDIDTREDLLTLLDMDGQVLTVRSLLEIIKTNPDGFRLQQVKPQAFGGAAWVDLLHSNSVEWMPYQKLTGTHPIYAAEHVLICSRHQDRIAVINWDTGRLIWSWGRGILSGPHDAHWLENGHLLVFDNGLNRGWSRVIEVNPVIGQIVWDYRAANREEFFTLSKGSAQRLPNGNTLITNSDNGQAFEVTRDGQIVWLFTCPYTDQEGRRAALVRTTRYEKVLVDGLIARSIRDAKKPNPYHHATPVQTEPRP